MQIQFRTAVIAAITALTLLSSCSKTNKQGRLVPKDAGFVIHMNAMSLAGKINMDDIKRSDWYKQIMTGLKTDTTVPDILKKLRDNSQATGVDSLSDFILFGENNASEGMKLVFEGGLKDAKAFENFLKNMYPEGKMNKDGDINIMPVKDKALVSWNNEKFIVGVLSPSAGSIYSKGLELGNDPAKDPTSSTQLAAYCKKLYTLEEKESLAKDEKFSNLMNTEGDMHFWINSEKLIGGTLQMGILSMMKIDKFLDGNISTLTFSFDNGKITIRSKGYAGKELSELFKKYGGGSINTDMLKNIPSQNIAGVFAFHFKPEGFKELVKLTGMDGFADLLLARQGFTIDDFVKANKGDIMISVTDLSVKKDSVEYKGSDGKMKTMSSENPDAKFLFSASIADKDAFNKLINAGKKAAGGSAGDQVSFNSNGNYFAIGNSNDAVSKYLAGGAKNDLPFLSKISGNAMGAYIDLQKIIRAFEPVAAKDSLNRAMWNESVKLWDNITFTGGDYSGGGYNQTMEINMLDKNTNSMKQLFTYMITLAKLAKEKKEKTDPGITVSDTKPEEIKKDKGIPPPPPAVTKKK